MTVLVAFCLLPNQSHHYEQNLVSKLYTTEPRDKDPLVAQLDKANDKDDEGSDQDEKGKDLINKLKTREPVVMSYWDKTLSFIICRYCCRSCIDEKRFERRQIVKQARNLVDDEIDVFSLVQTLRVAKFLQEISLKTNQRLMVRAFEKYHFADPSEKAEDASSFKVYEKSITKRLDKVTMSEMIIDYKGILREFSPETDETDKLIYHKIVGDTKKHRIKTFYNRSLITHVENHDSGSFGSDEDFNAFENKEFDIQ